MYKTIFPSTKRWSLISKHFTIPLQSNMSTSHHDHLHGEDMPKAATSMGQHYLNIIIHNPLYLQVVPNPLTEIAGEE